MINNVRDHVSPELETPPPRWSELGEAEMLLDSPHSIENFLEDLPVGRSLFLQVKDGVKIIVKIGVLLKIG
jgi:hypothetical protein